jgi:hypothetical protein
MVLKGSCKEIVGKKYYLLQAFFHRLIHTWGLQNNLHTILDMVAIGREAHILVGVCGWIGPHQCGQNYV